MELETPALRQQGQGLDNDFDEANSSTNPLTLHTNHNRQNVLDGLARKWVRFGCCDTPNEAMKVLLAGCHE